MKKTICLNCGLQFNSKIKKREHKKQFPDASCKGKFTDKEIIKSERDKSFEVSIPEAEAISMPEDQAKKELQIYRELLKTRSEKYLKEMKDCLVQLAKGRKVININEVMKKAGVREDGFPKLAIARADGKTVYMQRGEKGGCSFSLHRRYWNLKRDVTIWFSEGIFPEFKKINNEFTYETYQALVPIVPAVFLPQGKLNNYWILWEVERWEKTPSAPRDPILLKRINENTFAVLAVWDLTELERSIIGGQR